MSRAEYVRQQAPRPSDTRPTVLLVVTRWEVGGAQETLIELGRGLSDRGWTVVAVGGVPDQSDEAGADLASGAGFTVLRSQHLKREVSPLHDMRALWELFRLMRRLQPSVVHTHSSKAGLLGRLAAWCARVPRRVHTVHGWSFAGFAGAKRSLYVRIERALARVTHALCFVAQSDLEVGREEQIGANREAHIVRSAVNLGRFAGATRQEATAVRAECGIPERAEVVLSVTRLASAKDPDTLIDVLEGILRRRSNVHGVVIGDGPDFERVARRVDDAADGARLHLLGSRRDVPAWLEAADVFLLTDRHGGLPRALVEAMASGTPVVSTTFAGVPELISDGVSGFLCAVGDSNSLLEHAVQLVDDPALCRRMTEAGRAGLKEFSVETMVSRTLEVYEGPLGG